MDAFLFDLDGTLVDSRIPMVRALNETLRAFGRPPAAEDILVHRIGTPSSGILGEVGGVAPSDLPQAVEFSRRLYLQYQLARVDLFPGVREGLERLRRFPLALVTIRPRGAAEAVLRAAALLPWFRTIVGWEDVARPKPDPEAVLTALGRLGIDPSHASTVGDRAVDVLAGRAAGTRTVAVTYGYANPGELEAVGPDLVVDDLRKLPT